MTTKSDYARGWDDSIDYATDKHRAQSGTCVGFSLMLWGGAMDLALIWLSYMLWPINLEFLEYALAIFTVVGVCGFFLNRKEKADYEKRQDEFNNKWDVKLMKEFLDVD